MATKAVIPTFEEIVAGGAAMPSFEDIVGGSGLRSFVPEEPASTATLDVDALTRTARQDWGMPEPTAPDRSWLPVELQSGYESRPDFLEQLHQKTGVDHAELIPLFAQFDEEQPHLSEDQRRELVRKELYRREYKNVLDELQWGAAGGVLGLASAAAGSLAAVERFFAYNPVLWPLTRFGPLEWAGTVASQDAERWEKRAQELYAWAQNNDLQPGKGGGAKAFVANVTGKTLPMMTVSVASASAIGTVGAWAVTALVEGDNWVRDYLAKGGSLEEAGVGRVVVGSISGIIELGQVGGVFRVGKMASAEVVGEFRREVAERAMKKLAARTGRITRRSIEEAVGEGFEEVGQQWVADGTAIVVYGQDVDLKDLARRTEKSFVGGASAGWMLGSGMLVLQGSKHLQAPEGQPRVPRPPMVMTKDQYAAYEQQQAARATATEQAPPASEPTAVEPTGIPTQKAAGTPGTISEVPSGAVTVLPGLAKTGAEVVPSAEPAGPGVPPTPTVVGEPAAVARGAEAAVTEEQTVTLYHGTDEELSVQDLRVSAPSYEGSLGEGIYFGQDRPTAEFYGKNVLEVPVRIANPLVIDAGEETNYRVDPEAEAQRNDTGTYQSILPGEQIIPFDAQIGGKWVRIRTAEDLASLSRRAREAGHDALIVKGIRDNATVNEEVVVFDKNQIGATPVAAEGAVKQPSQVTEAPQAETAPEESPQVTSARQAMLNKDREVLGLNELDSPARRKWETALSEALAQHEKDPHAAQRLAASVLDKPFALNDAQTALLVVRANEIKNEHAGLMSQMNQISDPAEIQDLSARIGRIESEFDALTQALYRSGTEKGRALASQKLTINQDFSLVAVKNRAKAAKGKELTAAEAKKFEDLVAQLEAKAAQVQSLEKALAELKAAQAVKETRGTSRKRPKTPAEKQAERSLLTEKVRTLLEAGCR